MFTLTFIVSVTNIFSQNLDEEIGFIFVKAEYLYETSRYEDAIVQYNLVIIKDPKYKDALLKRATLKYKLAAYKGAKLDAMQAIDLLGISGSAASILAKAEFGMNQLDLALNNISAAIALVPDDAENYELRAKIYEMQGQMIKACGDLEKAILSGSVTAEAKARSLCGYVKNQTPVNIIPTSNVQNNQNTETAEVVTPVQGAEISQQTQNEEQRKSESDQGTIPEENPITEATEDETIPKEDNFISALDIDDDLIIEIYGQGLGRRKTTEIPSILILSDDDGTVSVDICVSHNGEVIKAEFNPGLSSIAKKSLVSLAIRKAKEFSFESALYPVQCGVMVFKIKGS